jgi:hypothetical protein
MLNAQSFNHSIEINGGVGLSKYTKYSIGAGYQSGIQITKKASPYLGIDGGYSFDVGQNPYKNIEGLFFEPRLGIDISINNGENSIDIGISPNIHKYHYTFFTENNSREERLFIGTLILTIGYSF